MKPLKIALIIVGPLVLIAGILLSLGGGGVGLSSRVMLVDVTTGETRSVSQSSIKMLPAPNDAGVMALFPVVKNEAGHYVIPDRYREAVAQLAKAHSLRVDPESLTVADAP